MRIFMVFSVISALLQFETVIALKFTEKSYKNQIL